MYKWFQVDLPNKQIGFCPTEVIAASLNRIFTLVDVISETLNKKYL